MEKELNIPNISKIFASLHLSVCHIDFLDYKNKYHLQPPTNLKPEAHHRERSFYRANL